MNSFSLIEITAGSVVITVNELSLTVERQSEIVVRFHPSGNICRNPVEKLFKKLSGINRRRGNLAYSISIIYQSEQKLLYRIKNFFIIKYTVNIIINPYIYCTMVFKGKKMVDKTDNSLFFSFGLIKNTGGIGNYVNGFYSHNIISA